MAIRPDEDMGGGRKTSGDIGLPGIAVGLLDRCVFPHDFSKALEVDIRLAIWEEIRWDDERIAIHHFCSGDVEAFLWSRSKT